MLIRSRRVCVLHGKPVTISKPEVDADQPSHLPELRSESQINTMPNVLAMINLTGFLEEARDKIRFSARIVNILSDMVCRSYLRKSPKDPKAFMLTSISQLGDALEE